MRQKIYRVWACNEMHFPAIITFDSRGASFATKMGGSYHVDFENVCEPTGLRDTEGNDIYEGDIIDGYVVTYCGNQKDGLGMAAGWYLQRGGFESWVELESRCNENGDNYAVTGNIYQNPIK